jgi:hypothetical protein
MSPLLAGARARPGKENPSGNTQPSTAVPPKIRSSGGDEEVTRFPGGLWLVGIHGGAGTTTLAAAGVGRDGGRRWPKQPQPTVGTPDPLSGPTVDLPTVQPRRSPATQGLPPGGLLLVVRETAAALTVATKAAEAVQRGQTPDWLQVLGMIVVAAGPGRPAKIVRERTALVGGWMPQIWRVPWVPELLAIDTDQVRYCKPFKAAIPKSLYELQELRRK